MSGHDDGPGPGGSEPIGSVAEEAAKLLGAFSGWAKEQGEGLSAFTDQVHDHSGSDAAHPAAEECTWCPLCRTVAAVREASPEVVEHLSSAASSFMLALSGLMTPPQRGSQGHDRAGVQRIPLDDDGPDDEGPDDESPDDDGGEDAP